MQYQPHAVGFGQIGQDDRELVAPHARYRVGCAQAALNARRRLYQQLVSAVVPERVVDFFEMVQIDKQNSQLLRVPFAFFYFLL